MQAQQARGFRLVTASSIECGADIFALELQRGVGERESRGYAGAAGLGRGHDGECKVAWFDRGSRREESQAFHEISQLADIAGPFVSDESLTGFRREIEACAPRVA